MVIRVRSVPPSLAALPSLRVSLIGMECVNLLTCVCVCVCVCVNQSVDVCVRSTIAGEVGGVIFQGMHTTIRVCVCLRVCVCRG